jgi:ABC-type dipeptide/oligopeptide/nickel transport system permease component
MTRASVLEVLNEDYIRTARAKGQVERKILFRQMRSAMPMPTTVTIGTAAFLSAWRKRILRSTWPLARPGTIRRSRR